MKNTRLQTALAVYLLSDVSSLNKGDEHEKRIAKRMGTVVINQCHLRSCCCSASLISSADLSTAARFWWMLYANPPVLVKEKGGPDRPLFSTLNKNKKLERTMVAYTTMLRPVPVHQERRRCDMHNMLRLYRDDCKDYSIVQNRNRIKLVRWFWRLLTVVLRAKSAKADLPDNFIQVRSFNELESSGLLESLLDCYVQVFKVSKAWKEEHRKGELRSRLISELDENANLTMMIASDKVVAFCWSQVLKADTIINGAKESISFQTACRSEWENLANKLPSDIAILFIHELGMLREYRGGITNLQILVRSALQNGLNNGVSRGLWWTRTTSKAYNLSKYIGFEPIAEVGQNVFLYCHDFASVVQVATVLDGKTFAKLFSFGAKKIVTKEK